MTQCAHSLPILRKISKGIISGETEFSWGCKLNSLFCVGSRGTVFLRAARSDLPQLVKFEIHLVACCMCKEKLSWWSRSQPKAQERHPWVLQRIPLLGPCDRPITIGGAIRDDIKARAVLLPSGNSDVLL